MFSIKLLSGVILLIFTLQRLYGNYKARRQAKEITSNLESDNLYAIEFANELNTQVLKIEENEFTPFRRKLPFNLPKNIANFQINFCKEVEHNTYLFIILAKYTDLEGKKEVTSYQDLYFKLVFDERKSLMTIYSDLCVGLVDKNLRYDFVKDLMLELKS